MDICHCCHKQKVDEKTERQLIFSKKFLPFKYLKSTFKVFKGGFQYLKPCLHEGYRISFAGHFFTLFKQNYERKKLSGYNKKYPACINDGKNGRRANFFTLRVNRSSG